MQLDPEYNGFGIYVPELSLSRWRDPQSDSLPCHLEPIVEINSSAAPLRKIGERYVDSTPCTLEMDLDKINHSTSRVSQTVISDEQAELKNRKMQEHRNLIEHKQAEVRRRLDQAPHMPVHTWRRPQQAFSTPTLFSEGNTVFKHRPSSLPPNPSLVWHCPRFAKGIYDDVYFKAALAQVASHRDCFSNLFVSTEFRDIGLYSFQFYNKPTLFSPTAGWQQITIDDQIPCNGSYQPIFGRTEHPSELYCILAEKAYAKFRGSYSYLHGGDHAEAMVHFTGGTTFTDVWNPNNIDTDNQSVLWWKLKCNTEHGLFTSVMKSTRQLSTDTGDPETYMLKRLDDRESLEWNDSTAQVVFAVELSARTCNEIVKDEDSMEKYMEPLKLVKVRQIYGNHAWKGDWSEGSHLWNPAVREYLNHKHVDDRITWMKVQDFVKQYDTVVTTQNFPGSKWVYYDSLEAVDEGHVALHADQFFIEVVDSQKCEGEPKLTLEIHLSQPDKDSIYMNYTDGADLPEVMEILIFKLDEKGLVAALNANEGEYTVIPDDDSQDSIFVDEHVDLPPNYVWPKKNRMHTKKLATPNKFIQREQAEVVPGMYMCIIQQAYHKDSVQYCLSASPTENLYNLDMTVESMGTLTEPRLGNDTNLPANNVKKASLTTRVLDHSNHNQSKSLLAGSQGAATRSFASTSEWEVGDFDSNNAFGLNLNVLNFDRFRNVLTGTLPIHVQTSVAYCEDMEKMCRSEGETDGKAKDFVDTSPVSLQISEIPKLNHLSTSLEDKLNNLEKLSHERELKVQQRDKKQQDIQTVLDNVYIWRRPEQVCPRATFFSSGNSIVQRGPKGTALPEWQVKYVPKWRPIDPKLFDDTYFHTAAAMAVSNRKVLGNVIVSCEYRSLGMYTFQFCHRIEVAAPNPLVVNPNLQPIWECVTVDDNLPLNSSFQPVLGRLENANELWCLLLEKAYAKYLGSYAFLHRGDTARAVQHLTGGKVWFDEWNSDKWSAEEEVGDGTTNGKVYDIVEGSNTEVNMSVLWWKLTEATQWGLLQACSKLPIKHAHHIHTYEYKETADTYQEWPDLNTFVVMQAIWLDTPGIDQYLIKLRNTSGNIKWDGPWSNASPLWTPELRNMADNNYVDEYITWMSIEDFVKQFNTLITVTDFEGSSNIFFREIKEVSNAGIVPYHAHQYLVTVTDPNDPTHEKVIDIKDKSKDAEKAMALPDCEILSDEEDDDEDEDDVPLDQQPYDPNSPTGKLEVDTASILSESRKSSQMSPRIKPGTPTHSIAGSSIAGSTREESRFSLHIYISQPNIGEVDTDGHFLCGANAKKLKVQVFKVHGREVQTVVALDADFETGTGTMEACESYNFPTTNSLPLHVETTDNGFKLNASIKVYPGYYIIAVSQDFFKDNVQYMISCQGVDNADFPTGCTIAMEDVGSFSNPLFEVKKKAEANKGKTQAQRNASISKVFVQ